MAVLLIGVRHRIRHIQITLDAPFDSVRRNALGVVADRPVNDALAARVGSQPEHGIIQLGDGVRRDAADFVERALDRREGKVLPAGVVPYFGAFGPEDPTFAVIDQQTNNAVRAAFRAGEVQRVDLEAVQKLRYPDALAVRFVEHEIAVKVSDRHRAGEVGVGDLRKRVGRLVVDKRVWIAGEENLRPVVRDGHGAGAGHVAQLGGRAGQAFDLVDFKAGHDVKVGAVGLVRPQPANRACPDFLLELQPRRAVKERRRHAAFRYDFREEVDHPVSCGVDAPGDIRRPKDRRLH